MNNKITSLKKLGKTFVITVEHNSEPGWFERWFEGKKAESRTVKYWSEFGNVWYVMHNMKKVPAYLDLAEDLCDAADSHDARTRVEELVDRGIREAK